MNFYDMLLAEKLSGGGGGGGFDAKAYFDGKMKNIVIPEGVTHPIRYVAYDENPDVIDFPSTTEKIQAYTLYGMTGEAHPIDVYVRSETPPTAEDNFFRLSGSWSIGNIYVPADSVDAYKSASRWSSFASVIKAIPE